MSWGKLSQEEIKNSVFDALQHNVSYVTEPILGVPASYLDDKVFSKDQNFLKDAPFLSSLVQNPNHIGCHTMGSSESFFAGTQHIEQELIRICAEDILKGNPGHFDGYVASGGTEANIQAIWIYRNLFQAEFQAKPTEIAILCSSDSHYSMDKAANLLGISIYKTVVDPETRALVAEEVEKTILSMKSNGIRYVACVANMMTTMFGSVDNAGLYIELLEKHQLEFRMHIDGAFGGFYYPFSNSGSSLNFSNPKITSVTLDAHKMAQAPYGTGIFICRKGLMRFATTDSASYVEGEDNTLIGSRSGANAIAVWMILSTYGPNGWFEKIYILQKRTEWLCEQLQLLNIAFFRNPFSNIVTMRKEGIPLEIAHKFHLVPDNHNEPAWYKIVVMEHVTLESLLLFIGELKEAISQHA